MGRELFGIGDDVRPNPVPQEGRHDAAPEISQGVQTDTPAQPSRARVDIRQQETEHGRIEKLKQIAVEQSEQDAGEQDRHRVSPAAGAVDQELPEDELFPQRRQHDRSEKGSPQRRATHDGLQSVGIIVPDEIGEQLHEALPDKGADLHGTHADHGDENPPAEPEPGLFRHNTPCAVGRVEGGGGHLAQNQPHEGQTYPVQRHVGQNPRIPPCFRYVWRESADHKGYEEGKQLVSQ